MEKNLKTFFQDIHYLRCKQPFILSIILGFAEFFYKYFINFKNYLYKKNFLKENKVKAKVICVGNLTTGGVGKTPITIEIANKLSKENKVAVISRGYGSKLNTKNPKIIKDENGVIMYLDGSICGDEPFQIASKVASGVTVVICSDRFKACETVIEKFGSEIIIMDDGFSNRKVKKDTVILVIDSEMKFGNGHLLPKGPLREPFSEIKRANEIYIVNKGNNDIENTIVEFRKYGKKLSICSMMPNRIYNAATCADIKFPLNKIKAVAFCAIGQPEQFFNFAKTYYDITPVAFEDHHKYTLKDINKLVSIAELNKTTVFITTQKDETKIKHLISDFSKYSFNVLELKSEITEL